ncbi:MAG TPA: DUF3226 domain-containing protein, partial [Ktedonobacteraceae bacterium]
MPELTGGPQVPPLTSRCVLLVEGNDEYEFLKVLAQQMNLEIGKDIEARQIKGKNFYKAQFQAFLNDPGFSNVQSYALIRDADEDASGAFASMQNILRETGQPCPDRHAMCVFGKKKQLKVGIFIIADHTANRGMLEDLCLQTVQDHPILPSVEAYVAQVQHIMQNKAPRNESKAKVLTFLAGMKELVPHLGIAAHKGYWNMASPALDELRTFLR